MTSVLELDLYADMLARLSRSGYRNSSFQELDGQSKEECYILRHDVDVSINSALSMAEVENECGVRAIYFFLLRSPLYNLLAKDSDAIIRRIFELGHEVALHFDPEAYENNQYDHIRDEVNTLTVHFPFANRTWVSFHRPGEQAQQLSHLKLPDGFRHTYEAQFFNELVYFSDSRGNWSRGNPVDSEEFRQGLGLQILAHPVWWCNDGKTASDKLSNQVRTTQEQYKSTAFREIFP